MVLQPGTEFLSTLPEALVRAAYLVGVVLLVLLAVVLQFVKVREVYGSSDSTPGEQRINCPSCGARTSAGSETCEYCEEPVFG